ncbi:transglycosylase domain-containing protein [Halalkalibacter oceani]|uniref:transglycosylase domain-containing protein n=1 Tax=Halalkalibacter oceani TaxID=1653776 RepID=UPI00339A529A
MRLRSRSAVGYGKKTGLFLTLFAALGIAMNGSTIYGFDEKKEKDEDAVLYYSSSTIHKITEAQTSHQDDPSAFFPVTADGYQEGIETYLQAATENMMHSQKNFLVEDYLFLYTESEASKRELLDQYLKSIQSGSEVWCILTAADTYLGKEVRELTVEETAMLVGHVIAEGEQPMPAAENSYASEPTNAGFRFGGVEPISNVQQVSSKAEAETMKKLTAPLTFPQTDVPFPAKRSTLDTL